MTDLAITIDPKFAHRINNILLAAKEVAMHVTGPKEAMGKNQHIRLMRQIKMANPAFYAALIKLQEVNGNA